MSEETSDASASGTVASLAGRTLELQAGYGNAVVSRFLAGARLARQPPDGGEEGGGGGAAGDARSRLLAGGFDDGGAYKEDGSGFQDSTLDSLLKEVGGSWGGGIDTTAAPAAGTDDGGGRASGGDSAGKTVHDHPPWVGRFQNQLITVHGEWSAEDRVAQRLLQVFLRAWTRQRLGGDMPASAAVFFGYVGAHEENKASQGLGAAGVPGTDSANWCQQASSYAICEALLRNGLRFKSPPGLENREKFGNDRVSEVAKQAGRYQSWLQKKPGERGLWGGDKCWASEITPGDMVSFYSAAHGPTSTGHAVTVITGAGAGEEAPITIASGNAAGESVRVEEVNRVQPPPGLYSGSTKRPTNPKDVYIWSLQRASILNAVIGIANSPGGAPDDQIAAAGLERCKPLDEIWPPNAALASAATTGGGGGTGAAAGGSPAASSAGEAPAAGPSYEAPSSDGGGGAAYEPSAAEPGSAWQSWSSNGGGGAAEPEYEVAESEPSEGAGEAWTSGSGSEYQEADTGVGSEWATA